MLKLMVIKAYLDREYNFQNVELLGLSQENILRRGFIGAKRPAAIKKRKLKELTQGGDI